MKKWTMKASENPFRSSEIDRIAYRFSSGSLEQLLRRLMHSNTRLWCLTGPEGTGKTTLLENIAEALPADTAIRVRYLNEDSSPGEKRAVLGEANEDVPESVLFLDGGEVLSRLQWWVLKKSIRENRLRLVATVHRNPGLAVLHQCGTGWNQVDTLIRERAGRHFDDTLASLAHAAFRESHGNVREVFRRCYLHLSG